MTVREVGRVVALRRCPVKPIAGEALTSADVGRPRERLDAIRRRAEGAAR